MTIQRACEMAGHPADTIELLNTYYTLMFEAISGQGGLVWREVEVLNDDAGQPHLQLHGSLEIRARQMAVQSIFVTLTHTAELAAASVILES